jgi:hypothetical protein
MRDGCPPEVALSRAGQAGCDPGLAEHLRACPGCRETSQALERAVRLARELPTHVPSPDRREELRAMLLATAASRRARASGSLTKLGLLTAAAVVVGVLWLARGKPGDHLPRSHATLRATPGARYAIVTPPPQETVRLWDGAVTIEVDPLLPTERLRVQVGDGEVEVRGTVFTVTARADHLVHVGVSRGRVEVRPAGTAAMVLDDGSAWRAAPVAEVAPALASPPPPPTSLLRPEPTHPSPVWPRSRAANSRMAAAPPRSTPTRPEALYDDAWDALRASDFARAAVGFAAVLQSDPAGPLADEATFWQATVLARSGSSGPAVATFRDFLARYPGSPRRGEASAMLGWLLVDAGQPEEAARHFRAAANDSHQTVRASARQGLQSLPAAPPDR